MVFLRGSGSLPLELSTALRTERFGEAMLRSLKDLIGQEQTAVLGSGFMASTPE